jgi:2-oxoglutarate dehydrogenase E1 component
MFRQLGVLLQLRRPLSTTSGVRTRSSSDNDLLLHRSRLFSTQAAAATSQPKMHENESFLTGTTSVYAEQMHEQYSHDPTSVHASWRTYFDNLDQGKPYVEADYSAPTIVPSSGLRRGATAAAAVATETAPSDSLGVAHLIRAYQVNGHLAARLDPLDTYSPDTFPQRPCAVQDLTPYGGYPPELTPEYHGFSQSDLDRHLNLLGTSAGGNKGYLQDLANKPEKVTLRQILAELRRTYTGTLGVEYMVGPFLRAVFVEKKWLVQFS